jgi:protein involved in temperature-dependent protein secretion
VSNSLQQAQLYCLPVKLEKMWHDLLGGRLRPDLPDAPSQSAIRLKAKLRELRDRALLIFLVVNGKNYTT